MKRLLLSAALAFASAPALSAQELPPQDIGTPFPDLGLLVWAGNPYAWLGVSVTEENGGLTVEQVMEASPAEEAGLKTGDRLLKVNGTAVTTTTALREQIGAFLAGDVVKLELKRGDKPLTLKATLAGRPGRSPKEEDARRLNEAVESLRGKGIQPPRGLLPAVPRSNPARQQIDKTPPEIQLDPFGDAPPRLSIDEPGEVQPLLKVEPEWRDGELQLKWNKPREVPRDLEEELKKALQQQHESQQAQATARLRHGVQDQPQNPQQEDLIWRRVQDAVTGALINSGASPQSREAAARAIEQVREDWKTREPRRRQLREEAAEIQRQIDKLRARSEKLQREAKELE